MTALAFPGQLPYADLSLEAGGCELGQGRCAYPAEVEVELPETAGRRQLCREHVGWFMLGTTTDSRVTKVLVRKLT